MLHVQQNDHLPNHPRFEFLDGFPDKWRRELSVWRVHKNSAKPLLLETILLDVIEGRGADCFVCRGGRRRVEIDAAHASAGDFDNVTACKTRLASYRALFCGHTLAGARHSKTVWAYRPGRFFERSFSCI